MTKTIVINVTKAGNDLVGNKMANKSSYLKHKCYFRRNNKCYPKRLLDKT